MVLIQFLKYLPDPQLSDIIAYSIEKKEWIMLLVFLIWVSSYAYLLISLRLKMKSSGAKISLTLLLISSIGLIIAGISNLEFDCPNKTTPKHIIHKSLKSPANERIIRYR